jgi:hypothetical protein
MLVDRSPRPLAIAMNVDRPTGTLAIAMNVDRSPRPLAIAMYIDRPTGTLAIAMEVVTTPSAVTKAARTTTTETATIEPHDTPPL